MAGYLEYDQTANNNTTINGIGIQGTNNVQNFDNALRQFMADTANYITRRVTKSANYTALKSDAHQLIEFTASATLSLTAAATLTDGWSVLVKANGGNVTVDPNGAETIDGNSAITIPDGSSATIFCDGSSFHTSALKTVVRNITDAGILSGFRNKIINGNFNVWQQGTVQTTSGFGSDDRWGNYHSGSTKIHSRQPFSSAPDLPGNPECFSRTEVTAGAGSSDFCSKEQAIEDVRTLAGKRATLTFYARTLGSAKDISVEFTQNFGTGSADPVVLGIGVTRVTLSTVFQRYDVLVDLPSVEGKDIKQNSYVRPTFWFDAGSDYNARTLSLGHQSGTFDLAVVSIVEGDATGETDPSSARSKEEEERLCLRYLEASDVVLSAAMWPLAGTAHNTSSYFHYQFKARKRVTPTVSAPTIDGGSLSAVSATRSDVRIDATASGASTSIVSQFIIDAEIHG